MTPAPPLPQVPPPLPPARGLPVLAPHLIWEALLLLALVAVAVAAATLTEGLGRESTWWAVAFFGLLASGFALSLRCGGANLAVVGVATFSGAVYVTVGGGEGDVAPLAAAGLAVAAATGVGLLLGLVAGLTSVPGWAVSLGGLALVEAAVFGMLDSGGAVLAEPLPAPLDEPPVWVGIFLVVSLVGGGIAAIRPVARWFAARRDPGPRFSGGRLVGSLVGFTGSSLLAGLAGLVAAGQFGAVLPGADLFNLLLVVGVVLVAGVSAFGGRGGIAGTALAVALLVVIRHWLAAAEAGQTVFWVVAGAALLLGVLVNRLLEVIAPFRRPELSYTGPVL